MTITPSSYLLLYIIFFFNIITVMPMPLTALEGFEYRWYSYTKYEQIQNEGLFLTIVHQNDIHSHFGLISRYGYKCIDPGQKTCYGGFSRAVHYVKDLIENDKYSKSLLIVNSGDFYKGNQYYSEFKWRLVVDMIQHMPYTALTLGDAEFTDGIDGLVPLLRAIGNKYICTNIDFSGVSNHTLQKELRELCPRHRIVTYDSNLGPRHVCLLSYTTPLTQKLMASDWARFENEEKALTREIMRMRADRPEVKIFVALGHSGYERDKQIAHRVPSLDVIIGGHSHTLLWPNIRNTQVGGVPDDPHDKQFAKDVYPTKVIQPSGRTVLIVQMYKHGKYLGILNVTFNGDDEVDDFYTGPVLLTDEMPADAETEKSLDKYRQRMVRKQQQVIGSTRVELVDSNCTNSECNLGNLATDAVLWHVRHYATHAARTLVAVVNAGAIRQGIKPGKFKMADITASFPFPDTLYIVKLRGATIRKMLEHSVGDNIKYNFLQISGMRVRYNMSKPPGERVDSVRILCQTCVSPRFEPLNDTAAYHTAMFSYLAVGNDGFTMVKNEMLSSQPRHDVSMDIVAKYARRFSPLHPYLDGRIEIVRAAAMNSTAPSQHGRRTLWTVWAAVTVVSGAMLSATSPA